MARFLRTVLVGVTGAALLVSPAIAAVAPASNGCASDADESACVCCPSEHARRDCCAPRGSPQSSTERDGCGSCPAGGCCGCCVTAVAAVAVENCSAPAESALAVNASQTVERFASRDDEPLLPPPIA